MPRSRRSYWWIGLAVAALVAVVLWSRQGGAGADLQFETATVDRGPIVVRVTASGTLSAVVTVEVSSQVSGRILEILVDYNSPVRKGQVLARLDPQFYEAALQQARANHLAAQGDQTRARVQADDAVRQLERARELSGSNLLPDADLDAAQARADAGRAEVATAAGRVEQAAAALHQARVNLAYTTITSPIDGTVISRDVDVGQTVAASLQAPTMFVLAEDLRKMQVNTSVAEADIGRLRAGMSTSFTVDAYPSERFQGVVRQIRNAPQTVQNVVTYDAVVDVANPDLKLRPGMTANVTFAYADRPDVLRIPNAALRFRPDPALIARGGNGNGGGSPAGGAPTGAEAADGSPKTGRARGGPGAASRAPRPAAEPDRRTVFIARAGRLVAVPIRVGVSDGTLTELLEGDLREGDALVTEVIGGGEGGRGAGRPAGRVPRVF